MRELVRLVAGACAFALYTLAIGGAFGIVWLTVTGAGWAVSLAFDALWAYLLQL